jgi:hypothetical protein
MKTILAIAAFTALALSAPAQAANSSGGAHPFGLGLMVGAPTGLTGKLYLAQPFALQMGLGWVDDFDDDDGLHVHLDFVWHPVILSRSAAVTLPLYLGVGGRIWEHDHHFRFDGDWYDDDHTTIGLRAPLGLLIDFNRVPLDIFLEIALTVDVVDLDDDDDLPFDHDHDRVGLNGGVGVRYYF